MIITFLQHHKVVTWEARSGQCAKAWLSRKAVSQILITVIKELSSTVVGREFQAAGAE